MKKLSKILVFSLTFASSAYHQAFADCQKAAFDAAVNQAAMTDDVYAESCIQNSLTENPKESFYRYLIVISCEKEMGTEMQGYDIRVNSNCTEVFADPHLDKEDD